VRVVSHVAEGGIGGEAEHGRQMHGCCCR
jgi:hypothetical protein